MPRQVEPVDRVFDGKHYAATLKQKLIRSLQLGPKYYLWDLPRYFAFRRSVGLRAWDGATLLNPFREFSRRINQPFDMPPGYRTAFQKLREVGVRVALPQIRLMGLLSVWWACRTVPGDVIECGSYQGATGLLLALLGRANSLEQNCLLLDTFSGTPAPCRYDGSRVAGEFAQPAEQVAILRRQAEMLEVADRVKIHRGLFCDTFAVLKDQHLRFSFAHVDANIYSGTLEACEFVMPRMNRGSAVVFDDYNGVCDLGARLAIDKYFRNRPERLKPLAGTSAFVVVA